MSRQLLAILAACLCCMAFGYARGFGAAEARGRVLLAEQSEACARGRQAQAEASAEAERALRQRLEAEAARMSALAGELSETRSRLDSERQAFNRRMARVAKDASNHCPGLPDGWVRLYNQALGLASGSHSPSSAAPGADEASHGSFTAGSGVRPDTSPLASPADLLAHARDYGGYCRSLRAQAEALIAAARSREKTP